MRAYTRVKEYVNEEHYNLTMTAIEISSYAKNLTRYILGKNSTFKPL